MRMKLEAILECLLNGEQGEASKMLHEYIVDRSRAIYNEMSENDEEVMEVSDMDAEDEAAMYEVEGDDAAPVEFGGDESEDFTGDVEADGDAEDANPFGDDMGADEGEMSTEDRLAELEASLEELMAEFDALTGGTEEGEAEFDAPQDDAEADMPFGDADQEVPVAEATAFYKKYSVDMKKEGAEAGDGGSQSVDTANTFAKPKLDTAGRPIKTDTSAEAGGKAPSYQKDKPAHLNTKADKVAAPKNSDKPVGKSVIGEGKKKTK